MQTVHNKYHATRPVLDDPPQQQQRKDKSPISHGSTSGGSTSGVPGGGEGEKGDGLPSESDILMEISVRTLMTFFTSLMRMSWASPDARMGVLCTDVLRSSSSMLMSIPGRKCELFHFFLYVRSKILVDLFLTSVSPAFQVPQNFRSP